MSKFFILILMIVILLISMLSLYILNSYLMSSILLIVSFVLTFIVVNTNNKFDNFINLQSFFLFGFFLFFLGRFAALLIDSRIYENIFCLSFIFNYCETMPNIIYLILIINLILIFYALAFVVKGKGKDNYNIDYIISKKKIAVIYIITFFSLLLVIHNTIDSIVVAINQGYLALYENQAEAYQTPYALVIRTFSVASMAILYSIRKQIKPMFFNIIFYIFLLSMLINILTGSRSAFISSLLLLVWHFYGNKSIDAIKYLALLASSFLVIYTIDIIAAISGARPAGTSTGYIQSIVNGLHGQGTTLMIFNSSIGVEGFPILGYIKTLLPGIQILFPLFGVTERREFDWTSYMTYHENKEAYNQGLGLGWSIFSDFYVLSFNFLPIFCLLVYLFGRFTMYASNANNNFRTGLLFICIISFFGLSRSSISPLIFIIIIYAILSLYVRSLRISKRMI